MGESAFITSNFVANTLMNIGLVTVAGYLIKRYVTKMDDTVKNESFDRKNDAKKLALELRETRQGAKEDADRLAVDLKDTVTEHRQEIKDMALKLDYNLNKIYEQLRFANGRTGKIEGKLDTQIKLCEERRRNGVGH
jgi:hypothetical protein